jgi:hypothetical protein
MLAKDFLALCETDWPEADMIALNALGYVRKREGRRGYVWYDPDGNTVDTLEIDLQAIDAPPNHPYASRADAGFQREVEDALYRLAAEKETFLTLYGPNNHSKDYKGNIFPQFTMNWKRNGRLSIIECDNLSWLYAAALVELTTEGK